MYKGNKIDFIEKLSNYLYMKYGCRLEDSVTHVVTGSGWISFFVASPGGITLRLIFPDFSVSRTSIYDDTEDFEDKVYKWVNGELENARLIKKD